MHGTHRAPRRDRAPRPGRASPRALVAVVAALGVAVAGAGTAGAGAAGVENAGATASPPLPSATRDAHGGYAVVTATGQVATFGGAGFQGDLSGRSAGPVVAAAATPRASGYWLVEADGAVQAFGDAHHGRRARVAAAGRREGPVVAVAADPDGTGYWLATSSGQVLSVHAPALPAAPPTAAEGPVVALASAGSRAVWLLTRNGAVLRAATPPRRRGGAAPGSGPPPGTASAGNRRVTRADPAVALVAVPGGSGYWIVTAEGMVLSGDGAPAVQSPTAVTSPVTGAAAAGRAGLRLVLSDGTVVAVGDARWEGDDFSPLHPPDYPAAFQGPPTDAVALVGLAPGPQAARRGPLRVTFLGDSLSVVLGGYTHDDIARREVDARVAIGGIMGCGVAGGLELATYSSGGPLEPTLPACALWRQQYRASLAASHPDVVVILLGYWESQRHRLGGRPVTLTDSAAYRERITGALEWLLGTVHAAGARALVLTAPIYGDGTPVAQVDVFNRLLLSAARRGGATVLDLGRLLDPAGRYTSRIDGITVRSADRVHLTEAGVERVVDPVLVPRMLALARAARRTG